MKFYVSSTTNYEDASAILAYFPRLKDFGYAIENQERVRSNYIKDETGKYIWQDSPYIAERLCVEICDADRLMELIDTVGCQLVITRVKDGVNEIEIYDGYRE